MIWYSDLREIDTAVCDYFVICNGQTHKLTQ
jgi:hypothetical protein